MYGYIMRSKEVSLLSACAHHKITVLAPLVSFIFDDSNEHFGDHCHGDLPKIILVVLHYGLFQNQEVQN